MGHPCYMRRWGPSGLWVLFTMVAVLSGLLAVALVGQAVTASSGAILSAADVEGQLAAEGSAFTAQPGASRTVEPGQTLPPDHSPGSTPKPTHSRNATDGSSPPTATQSPSNSASPSHSTVRTISSRGGTVVAECSGGRVYLRSWSPASGFRVSEVRRGPASETELRFDSSSLQVQLQVRCSGGAPVGSQGVSADGSGSDDSGSDDSGGD